MIRLNFEKIAGSMSPPPGSKRPSLNDQGTELEGTECGVVLLPPVEQEEKE